MIAVRRARPLGIEIRAGLHTGECELMEDDVRGLAVHIAARVAASAGAGEVIVSSTVKDLVAGSVSGSSTGARRCSRACPKRSASSRRARLEGQRYAND